MSIALAVIWVALAVAYYTPYPLGFWVTSLAFGLYVAAALSTAARHRGARRAAHLAALDRADMSLVTAALPGLGWLLGTPFMRNAFLAGTLIALACGLVGYFLVLRAQVFTSDALGHVAFTAALGALAFGLDPRLGLFAGTILVALAMAALGRRASADDVVIGSTFAWVLGLGVLFLTLYTTQRSTANGVASVN